MPPIFYKFISANAKPKCTRWLALYGHIHRNQISHYLEQTC